MSLNLHAAKPSCQALLKQCFQRAKPSCQAIKQNKTILDGVGSSTTYYLHRRKVDSLASLFSGSLFVENSVAP